MMRKKIAILFFLIAQVIVQGHGIILHHHHSEEAETSHSHFGEDGIKQHPDENPLELAFSGFSHAGDHITFTQSDIAKYDLEKQVLEAIKSLPCDFVFITEYSAKYQKNTFPPDGHIILPAPLYGAYSLRGPPSFIVA